MDLFLWLMLAWMAGTAAILGSLMTIASVLLWFIPHGSPSRAAQRLTSRSAWVHRGRLTGVALLIAGSGLLLLAVVPFPQH